MRSAKKNPYGEPSTWRLPALNVRVVMVSPDVVGVPVPTWRCGMEPTRC